LGQEKTTFLVDFQAMGMGKSNIAAILAFFTIEIAKNAALAGDGDGKLRLCGLIFSFKAICADPLSPPVLE